jgi:hypothetical protein
MATKPIELKINSGSYKSVNEHPLFITPELKGKLEKTKFRGETLMDSLTRMGFSGGKHLIETLREKYGAKFKVILSHEESQLGKDNIVINLDQYKKSSRSKFFQLYRETGLKGAVSYLNQQFPDDFPAPADEPTAKEAAKVLTNLPDAAQTLTKKQQADLPAQIAALVERQGPDFVFALLSSIDSSVAGGSGRIKESLKDVIAKLAKEPAKAMNELSDLMDEWNLLQVTSLLSIVKSRLETIAGFEQLIHDEKTFELKEKNSVHRTLERSMWLLNDEYWIAQSNRSLRTYIGDELVREDKAYAKKRPDFACVNSSKKVIIVEIKRPSLELGKEEIDQAELYLRIVKKYKDVGSRPTIFLIGKKKSDEATEIADMRGYPKLFTYQEMLDNARERYQEYLRVVEGGDA